MQFILNIDVFFDLVFSIDWAYYFLTYGNIKMARYNISLNGALSLSHLTASFLPPLI